MRTIKKFFYLIVALFLACCVGVLVCALNPSLTAGLAAKLQGVQTEAEQDNQGIVPPVTGDTGIYEIPEDVAQVIPDNVREFVGYQPITGKSEEVSGTEADNLGSILSPGKTGEGHEFDSEFYPYYTMLDDTLKQLYRQIYANALELNTSFKPVVSVSMNQAKNVMEAVYNDHPELFWLDASFSGKYLGTGICVELTLVYNEAANDLSTAKDNFSTCAEAFLTGARQLATNYEKEQYIHNALIQIVEYDMSAKMNQSAYSALVLGRSVCAGYSRAFQYLMQQLGIPCYYCTGYAGGNHAWNIVKTEEAYRNVDVTWDDTEPSTYDYYNKSDSVFRPTHIRTDLSVYLPACRDIAQTVTEDTGNSIVDAHINPDPQEPLRWYSRVETEDVWTEAAGENEPSEEEIYQANLDKAGIKDEDVLAALKDYYEDCEKSLKDAGKGYKQFTNIIPESLWSTVEKAYSSGEYKKGYVDAALKEMKAEYFAIQLQVQRLGGGFCKLYHNVYTE